MRATDRAAMTAVRESTMGVKSVTPEARRVQSTSRRTFQGRDVSVTLAAAWAGPACALPSVFPWRLAGARRFLSAWLAAPAHLADKNHHADKSAPPATKTRHFQGNVRTPSDVPVAGGASHDPVFDGLLLTFSIVWTIFTR